MMKYTGKPVYGGIVQGLAVIMKKPDFNIAKRKAEYPEHEIERVNNAIKLTQKQIQTFCDQAITQVGEEGAAIFEVHQIMLEDEEFLDTIFHSIRTEQVNAEYAAALAGENFSKMFAMMDDEYMKARYIDIEDISEHLVKNLIGWKETAIEYKEASVLIADDLTPSAFIQLDKDKIHAFVTTKGSANSHTAILARMMKMPAIVGAPLELEKISTGMQVTVDGNCGDVIFEPYGVEV